MTSLIVLLVVLGITITILVVLFLVIRDGVLWYWKVDRIVALLESIDGRLARAYPDTPEAAARRAREMQEFRDAAAALNRTR